MTDAPLSSDFRTTAVASGLVTADDLDEAARSWDPAAPDDPNAPKFSKGTEDDQRLAAQLVKLDKVNAWQAEQLLAGRVKFNLGPYLMIDAIGQGGMGQVFKAVHDVMGRVVAVKVLPRHKSTPAAIAAFTREIRAQALLDHPNLVRAFDAGHDGNVHFLVTEYVPGQDLRRLVRQRGKLDMVTAAGIIAQVAAGLEHAHEQGLIHRDVKPGNVLVTRDGRAKLSDLGLVGVTSADLEADPTHGKIVGTADYLAPEQIRSPREIAPISDIYALGCTLYYAVTGKVPFPGGSVRDKARAHCKLQPIHPQRLNAQVTPEFADLVASMMAKDPADRVASAREVVGRLSAWSAVAAPPLLPTTASGGGGASSASSTPSGPTLRDTDPEMVLPLGDQPSTSDSSDQSSQPTHPMASASDETFSEMSDSGDVHRAQWLRRPPWLRRPRVTIPKEVAGFPLFTFAVLVVGAVAALSVLVMAVLRLF